MVGVSHWARTSRSDWLNGRSAMGGLLGVLVEGRHGGDLVGRQGSTFRPKRAEALDSIAVANLNPDRHRLDFQAPRRGEASDHSAARIGQPWEPNRRDRYIGDPPKMKPEWTRLTGCRRLG